MYIYFIIIIIFFIFIFLLKLLHLSRERNEAWNEHDHFKYDRGSCNVGTGIFFFLRSLQDGCHLPLSTGN